jgi:thiamine pyrophosphate-dependent acetolactate synthase large subunit-like protein
VPDIASLARSLGLLGYGRVTTDNLRPTLRKAVADVKDGNAVVVDVQVTTA